MERISKLIPEIIVPFKAFVAMVLILSVILLVQTGIDYLIQDNKAVWQGTCSFKEWSQGENLGMVVDCDEHGADTLTSVSFIKSYLDNPGPLTCTLSAADSISCKNRPALESAED
jgi:hypothetical protein